VPQAIEMCDGLLDQGVRIAAVGGSDDHTAGRNEGPNGSPIGSPTTRVLADELSEAAIIDGVRHGRTIVQLRGPDDPLLEVTMLDTHGLTAQIGDDIDGIAHVRLGLHVSGGAGMFAAVVRNGVVLEPQLAITGDEFRGSFDDTPGPGAFRYRVELLDDTNRRIEVTSHFYVRAVDAGGCFCSAGGDPAGGALAVVAMLVVRRRRRARAVSS
jgi:MYXO-CTERM domain-containing protein